MTLTFYIGNKSLLMSHTCMTKLLRVLSRAQRRDCAALCWALMVPGCISYRKTQLLSFDSRLLRDTTSLDSLGP